jgi:alpha-N-arabinofuranosidase
MDATASTRVRFTPAHDGERAGLAAVQSNEFFYLLSVNQDAGREVVKLERRAGPKDPEAGVTIAEAPVPRGAAVELRIAARGGRYDFAYALQPGRWTSLAANQDGTILSTRTAGGFVGATFGLYAYAPTASTGDAR